LVTGAVTPSRTLPCGGGAVRVRAQDRGRPLGRALTVNVLSAPRALRRGVQGWRPSAPAPRYRLEPEMTSSSASPHCRGACLKAGRCITLDAAGPHAAVCSGAGYAAGPHPPRGVSPRSHGLPASGAERCTAHWAVSELHCFCNWLTGVSSFVIIGQSISSLVIIGQGVSSLVILGQSEDSAIHFTSGLILVDVVGVGRNR
jgi:hypothetical protein